MEMYGNVKKKKFFPLLVIAGCLVIVFVVPLIVSWVFGVYIQPGKAAFVKETWGKGWTNKILTCGFHKRNPFTTKVVQFNRTWHSLDMSKSSLTGSKKERDDVKVPTTDGTYVWNDVTLVWQPIIDPAQVPGVRKASPKEIQAQEALAGKSGEQFIPFEYVMDLHIETVIADAPTTGGKKGFYIETTATVPVRNIAAGRSKFSASEVNWEQQVRSFGTGEFQKSFGRIMYQDYYDSAKRIERAKVAHNLMLSDLLPYGIMVKAVFPRWFEYEAGIDAQIKAKNLQVRSKAIAQAQETVNNWTAACNKEEAEGQALIAAEIQRGEEESKTIAEGGITDERKKKSDGDRLVAVAIANGEKSKAAALAGIASTSRLYKARQIAPKLAARLKGGIITAGDPSQSPLSIQYWLNLVSPSTSSDGKTTGSLSR